MHRRPFSFIHFYLCVSQREPKFSYKIALHFYLRSVTNRHVGLKTPASLCVPACCLFACARTHITHSYIPKNCDKNVITCGGYLLDIYLLFMANCYTSIVGIVSKETGAASVGN